MRRKTQPSLFPDENMVSLEEFKKVRSRPRQHEKKFMADIMQIARSLGLPCLHIEYFCGNKFYAICEDCTKRKNYRVEAKCPCCGKRVLAHCINRINKRLTHEFDIVGIEWGIETKHKINKREQKAIGKIGQQIRGFEYDGSGTPHITINEEGAQEAYEWLQGLAKKRNVQ